MSEIDKPAAKPTSKADKPPKHLVLTTSRVMGPEGRSLARGRIVLAPDRRAGKMIKQGHGRPATPEEIKSAAHPIVTLD